MVGLLDVCLQSGHQFVDAEVMVLMMFMLVFMLVFMALFLDLGHFRVVMVMFMRRNQNRGHQMNNTFLDGDISH
jgi:hypothetical protein